MVPLPIDPFLPEIVARLKAGTNLVLVAEPGAGKTTRVPPALVTGGVLSPEHPAIVMLQPRRVAARAAAERIAEERNWQVGGEVGYQVRFERRIGPSTRVRVLTEAILSRQLLSDPELPGIGCVVLDEFHERSIHSDLALALLREVQLSLRPDLRILVMSATLDAGPVSRFLGDCPVLSVPGRTFPVTIEHRTSRGTTPRVEDQTADAIAASLGDPGHILAFLPGAEEIRRTERLVGGMSPESLVLPLHGSLPFDEQRRAVAPEPGGRRKIILATNLAETSLTIDGVTVVVDSGLSRQTSFDPRRGLEKLSLGRISKASAAQRAGRAGRTSPGKCVRLWTAKEHNELADFDAPELRRVDLTPTLLMLLAWGVRDVTAFGWFEPPAAETVSVSLRLLRMLGAVTGKTDQDLAVTPLGRRMSTLPLHPRLARLMLDAADEGRGDEGVLLAAILSERDFRLRDRTATYRDRRPTELADSDLDPRVELLAYAERRSFHFSLESEGIDVVAARQVVRTREELRARLRDVRPDRSRTDLAPDLALAAYPDRVCLRRASDPGTALMVGGIGITLAPECAVRHSPLFLALDAREDDRNQARQAVVTLAHAVTEDDLRRTFPHAFAKVATCVYDPDKDKVVGRVQTRYHDLVLTETDDAKVDDAAAAEALADALLPQLDDRLSRDEPAANLLARVALAAKHVTPPEGVRWPTSPWQDHREAVVAALHGLRRLADFRPADFLRSLLAYPLDRLLDEHAPTHWTVPTGNRIRIDYTPPSGNPALSVRLQELFGATATPRVCRGQVPLVLHLLSPGYKPVQITQDLTSFWKNTYEQVRKDLRARYPKHSWPDDPLTAPPVAKGRPMR